MSEESKEETTRGHTAVSWDDIAEALDHWADEIEALSEQAACLVSGPEFPDVGRFDPRKTMLSRAKFASYLDNKAKELRRMGESIPEGHLPTPERGTDQ